MSAPLYDAHNHLAAPSLAAHRHAINESLNAIGLKSAVVNGTSPEDWPTVLQLAREDSHILPAIGLHPWKVNAAPLNWREQFLKALDRGAKVIGEIGLDQWIEDHDIERQQEAFRWQLAQATKRNLPVSIHCLRAMGPLLETLRAIPLPARGFHLHAYNGSPESITELVQLGAYFSFNGGQLKPEAKTVRAAIRTVPLNRLLIETDAPDMLPPPELREFVLPTPDVGRALNHPANLRSAYQSIAEIREINFATLVEQIEANFVEYFGD
jgi:TatD DNase family protein